jgi:hypothetical protein
MYIKSLDIRLTPSRVGDTTSFTILANKLLDRTIHFLRMTVRKEMLPALNNLQPRIRALHKQLDLPLRIGDSVNSIASSMQPKHRTNNVRKPSMQPVSIPQVDGRHADTLPALFANIVGGDFVPPELAVFLGTVFAETDVNEEVGEVVAGGERGDGFEGGPFVDVDCEVSGGVPAA